MRIYRIAQDSPDVPSLHKDAPVSHGKLQEMIRDILELYPETEKISIAGTYARADETPSAKPHDLDVLIYIPKGIEWSSIQYREDSKLWSKWEYVPVDFILKYGDKPEWMVGQHRCRIEEGLPTPEVMIWERA